jgi:ubiquinol oxidase
MAFVADHPELEFENCSCSVADDYGCAESFADVLRQIGVDERHHKNESLAELAEMRQPEHEPSADRPLKVPPA